jgi:hypothetical protein
MFHLFYSSGKSLQKLACCKVQDLFLHVFLRLGCDLRHGPERFSVRDAIKKKIGLKARFLGLQINVMDPLMWDRYE